MSWFDHYQLVYLTREYCLVRNLQCEFLKFLSTHSITWTTFSINCTNMVLSLSCIFTFLQSKKFNIPRILFIIFVLSETKRSQFYNFLIKMYAKKVIKIQWKIIIFSAINNNNKNRKSFLTSPELKMVSHYNQSNEV